MRRMILTAATSSLVLALAPASALAHGHHHKRHAKHHARSHRVIHRRFGDVNNPTTPTTTPGTTTPTPNAVGTVDSFDGTTLTIKLNSGSTVSGTVTNDTEIECSSASMTSDVRRDGGGGDSSGGSGDQNGGGDTSGQSDNSGQSDDSGQGDDDAQQQQACSTSSLTPGASVSGAELKISSAGSAWDKVDLIS